jgi:transposase
MFVAPPTTEVHEMVEPEVVRQVRLLADSGWGAKRIAAEVGVARNTVRRYLRGGPSADVQVRRKARKLDDDARAEARQLLTGVAEGNAVVVRSTLAERGVEASLRTVQRAVQGERRAQLASTLATVRVETSPGHQMQIDFGQKRVRIGERDVTVHLMAAVLSYSRRIFVKPFLAERGDDWREGVADAFRHFGGVVRRVLGDNAKALVVSRDRATSTVTFHPAYLSFCRDWGVEPRACAPYRARTKGKVESGVKFVKRNALAGRAFASFAELEQHLRGWMHEADRRKHGTTFQRPIDLFERDEASALRALPASPLSARHQRLRRRVASDALVDVDTVRYSVPHRFVRESVEVAVTETEVRIFRGAELVARHRRSTTPHDRVVDLSHYEGLWRVPREVEAPPTSASPPEPHGLAVFGRSLADYADVIAGVQS